MKKTFSAIPAMLILCCGVFVGTALSQDDDFWGNYNSSSPTEMSMPEPEKSSGSSDAPAGWESRSTTEDPPAANKTPVKSEKAPAAKAAKPAKEATPKAAASALDGRNFNLFINTGWGFGQGGYLLREVNKDGGNSNNKDYYMNMSQGLKFEAGAGYMAAPNLEMRFSVDFNFGLFAPKIEYNNWDKTTNTSSGKDLFNYSYWSWGVRAMAVPQFEVLEILDMYVGTGLSLNFAYGTEDYTFEYTDNATDEMVHDMRFSPAVGFCGIVGLTFPFSEIMDFFGELQFESKSFTLKKRDLKDHKESERNTTGSPPSETKYTKNDGTDAAPQLFPGSNWGIRVGLRFWFAL